MIVRLKKDLRLKLRLVEPKYHIDLSCLILPEMNWIQHPVILEGKRVRLLPLDRTHFEELLQIGSSKQIWEFFSIDGSKPDNLLRHLESAVLKRATGEQYPFTVVDIRSGAVIGSTLFYNIFPAHRKLEIGWTWYAPEYWRTGYNRECKFLLLTFCFEVLKAIRVQFATDELNQRSSKAILGIGAQFEGLLRNERIKEGGVYRNTLMYSIVESEWPDIKHRLATQLKF